MCYESIWPIGRGLAKYGLNRMNTNAHFNRILLFSPSKQALLSMYWLNLTQVMRSFSGDRCVCKQVKVKTAWTLNMQRLHFTFYKYRRKDTANTRFFCCRICSSI